MSESPSTTANDLLAEARAALVDGAWERARRLFDEIARVDGNPEACEGLAWAAWWQDDADVCIDARERAYRGYRDHGDERGAARMALWLGDDHLEFRGEEAIANGWFQVAGRILDALGPCPEQAWRVAFEAYAAIDGPDVVEAKRLCRRARELGRAFGLVDLELLTLAMEGVTLVDEGAVQQGMHRLDEAAAAALAADGEELTGIAYTCCLVVATCDRVRDVDRALQWCRKVEEFSRQRDIRFVHGACSAHHASVLVWHGDWHAAEAQLMRAIDTLDGRRPGWRLEAVVRLAELRRRQGRFTEAEALFAEAEAHPLARLGTAELCLDRGEIDTACALLDRALDAVPPNQVLPRAAPLELLVRASAAAGNLDAARAHLDELRGIGASAPIAPLRASVTFAEGAVAAAAGDHNAARRCFGEAAEAYSAGSAPFEANRARVALAESLAALGRVDPAGYEANAAFRAFEQLGAVAERTRTQRLLERLAASSAWSRPGLAQAETPLTPRQLEVLALVARGRTDRQIATELVLSEHTVHRHVANIYARLDCSSRAAAVAEAARQGLL